MNELIESYRIVVDENRELKEENASLKSQLLELQEKYTNLFNHIQTQK